VPIEGSDPGKSRLPRNAAIEMLRIVAAFEIIAYHSKAPFNDFMYSGLIVFLILSPFLECGVNWQRRRPIIGLAKSFLLPWLFWLLIYGVLDRLAHKPLFPGVNPLAGVLYGTSPHLWFMPYMFVVLSGLNLLKGRISPGGLLWPCAIGAASLLITAGWWRPESLLWGPPLTPWVHAMPAILIGIVFGLLDKVGRVSAVAASILVALSLCIAGVEGAPGVAIPYLVGAAALVLAAGPGRALPLQDRQVGWISGCSLGIYLSHIAFLAIFDRLTGHANYVTVTLTFATALGFTWIGQRWIPFGALVLGPPRRSGRARGG
jgi:fucose 4-O-acetylase-like acetyltransferase